MVTTNLLFSAFPSAVTLAFAVILGLEKSSSQESSMFSPVIATSKLVPACPPIGITVSKRGSGQAHHLGERRRARARATPGQR